ncbi:hypothetical protein CL6EHI_062720 [Entamoeba histolytica]|uniref:Uncharacterized protein n=6 Tax=Entamoeba histolytica TaxID=5759 RepID=C4M1P8_ENTH1|nr:hypothetical protein EHI_062720 [Entamoeba histolytica HM-1:IMSS]EAL45162.1 hypothetical protein EHI_062720 [Entamoeba histolytica HM-1:IMSS]EMD47220.1 Hypothetical protein EHI5A_060720 [Entamoeba histolytica KU27]ENY60244.1 hypothetical protein EHI7A_037920 [Entamoeba histolytica HM-1:IMSS-A]GAT95154.1 hypothetical protein CL6EHI_062720 [Entamoeba histolytica]|eukprot:XP_650548.1 hypothetical protein EHI_062720 [Entamoeba histolytica HM-1:IMSS]
MANVLLYFTKFSDVKSFLFVSKKCHNSCKVLKTNPLIEYGIDEKIKNWAYKIILFFPNIQTFRIKDLNVFLPQNIINNVSLIETVCNFDLYKMENGDEQDSSISSLTFPLFINSHGEYYFYDSVRNYLPGYPEGWLPKGIHSIGTEIHENQNCAIEKLVDYSIVSNYSAWWFLIHITSFKNLRYLTIILEEEVGWTSTKFNKGESISIYLEKVMNFLSLKTTLQKVKLITITNTIKDSVYHQIKKYPKIKFIIIAYDCLKSEVQRWKKIASLPNVYVLFKCVIPEILAETKFVISEHFSMKYKYGWYSSHIKNLCKEIEVLNYLIEKLVLSISVHCKIENLPVSFLTPLYNLSQLKIIEMHLVINTEAKHNYILPISLKSLVLSSDITFGMSTIRMSSINFCLQTPTLEYLQLKQLKLRSEIEIILPSSLSILNVLSCENITLKIFPLFNLVSTVFNNCIRCKLINDFK